MPHTCNDPGCAHRNPAVQMEDVDFSYGPFPVLDHVSVSIAPGEFISIVGPNGGGKTTLLKLMLGLLAPTRGRVETLGRPPVEARPRVGYVPQHWSFDLQFPVRVIDVVLMGRLARRRWFGMYGAEDRQFAQGALEEVRLGALAERPFAALSGGQRQRVLVARALASKPEMLLLDEPTSNMDVVAGEELQLLLRDLNKRMTIIMVTHDLGFVSAFVNRVVCVNRTVSIHPTSDVTGEVISGVYGSNVCMVRHDHTCALKEPT